MRKNLILFLSVLVLLIFGAGTCVTAAMPLPVRNAILSMTCVPENGQTTFKYNYAEDIGDGRGITFGIIGFTSGTYDGTILLRHLKELDPKNPLLKYLPAFEMIDRQPHNKEGLCNDKTGLQNFISDFEKYGNDTVVRKAQLDMLNQLYWEPAMQEADMLGLKYYVTRGELYDACVNHGLDGMQDIAKAATMQAGGTPRTGVDEKKWLLYFLAKREKILLADDTWKYAVDRVLFYRKLLQDGNINLVTPFVIHCYGSDYTITGAQP